MEGKTVWSGLNVQKNRVFLIYKKLLYELHKVAQEQERIGDMGRKERRWEREKVAAEPRYEGLNNGRTRTFKRYEAHMWKNRWSMEVGKPAWLRPGRPEAPPLSILQNRPARKPFREKKFFKNFVQLPIDFFVKIFYNKLGAGAAAGAPPKE